MKLSRLTPVVFIVWLVFYMFGNNMLPVTDPVESNYALTAKEMVLSGDWLSGDLRNGMGVDYDPAVTNCLPSSSAAGRG